MDEEKKDVQTAKELTQDEVKAFIATEANKAAEAKIDEFKKNYEPDFLKGPITVKIAKEDPLENKPGMVMARITKALYQTGNNRSKAAELVGIWKDKTMSEVDEKAQKALTVGTFSAGGFLVEEDVYADVLPYLEDASIVRAAGTPTVDMGVGLKVNKETNEVTSSWVGENENVDPSELTFGQISLSPKKLKSKVAVSNDLLKLSDIRVDDMIRRKLLSSVARAQDIAFLEGVGSEHTPRGVESFMNTANSFTTAGATAQNMIADSAKCISKVLDQKIDPDPSLATWIVLPQAWNFMMVTETATYNHNPNSYYVDGKYMDYQVLKTTSSPVAYSSNLTKLWFVDFSKCLIGETQKMLLTVDSIGSYQSGSNTYSLQDLDQTVIRIQSQVDFAMLYEYAAAQITSCAYKFA